MNHTNQKEKGVSMNIFFKMLTGIFVCFIIISNFSLCWAYYNFDTSRMEEEAENGHPEAQYYLARSYHSKTDGNPKNIEIAAKWYKKSAEQGYAEAQFSIAMFYWHGQGVEKDLDESNKWLKKAADQGHGYSMRLLPERLQEAKIAAKQNPVKKKPKLKTLNKTQVLKFNNLIKKAAKGDIEAQYQVGYMYANGKGVHQNDKEAVKWFHKAAIKGHKKAQHHIGLLYYKGSHLKQNAEKAIEWFTEASEKGYTDSTFMIGVIYMEGKGILKDTEKGFNYLYKAAENGHPKGQNFIGYCYATGECPTVSINIDKAREWFIKAAKQGDIEAMKNRKVVGYEQARAQYLKSRYGSSSGGYKLKANNNFWQGVAGMAGVLLVLSEIEKATHGQAGSNNPYPKPSEGCTPEYINDRLIYCYNESVEGIDAECGASLLNDDVDSCESAVQWEMEHGVPESYWWCDKKTHFVSPDKSSVIEKICQ